MKNKTSYSAEHNHCVGCTFQFCAFFMADGMEGYRFEEVVEPLSNEIETVEFYCVITDKSKIKDVLGELSRKYPLKDEYHHLKRVDKDKENPSVLKVLLCEKLETSEGIELPGVSGDQIITVRVPRYPAVTKEQFVAGRALWPINFHPTTPPPELTEEEKQRYISAMRLAIELGRMAALNGNLPVGMVILDKNGNIMGECGDGRKSMFLDHCCFAGIRDQSERMSMKLGRKRASKEDPYLCTDYDVVITREPCIMCGMCLLHSRVRRVIYGCDDRNGCFNSHIHLHYKEPLNHHFRVFRGVMEEQCRQLWSQKKDNLEYFV